MNKIVCLLLCVLCMGCAVRGNGGSYVGDLPEEIAMQAIANDMADYLADKYAAGHTTLMLKTPQKDAQNPFNIIFENSLRQKGFEVTATGEISVAYTVDAIYEENAWYAQIRLSDGHSLARSYTVNGFPEAGRVQFNEKEEQTVIDSALKKVENAWGNE